MLLEDISVVEVAVLIEVVVYRRGFSYRLFARLRRYQGSFFALYVVHQPGEGPPPHVTMSKGGDGFGPGMMERV